MFSQKKATAPEMEETQPLAGSCSCACSAETAQPQTGREYPVFLKGATFAERAVQKSRESAERLDKLRAQGQDPALADYIYDGPVTYTEQDRKTLEPIYRTGHLYHHGRHVNEGFVILETGQRVPTQDHSRKDPGPGKPFTIPRTSRLQGAFNS